MGTNNSNNNLGNSSVIERENSTNTIQKNQKASNNIETNVSVNKINSTNVSNTKDSNYNTKTPCMPSDKANNNNIHQINYKNTLNSASNRVIIKDENYEDKKIEEDKKRAVSRNNKNQLESDFNKEMMQDKSGNFINNVKMKNAVNDELLKNRVLNNNNSNVTNNLYKINENKNKFLDISKDKSFSHNVEADSNEKATLQNNFKINSMSNNNNGNNSNPLESKNKNILNLNNNTIISEDITNNLIISNYVKNTIDPANMQNTFSIDNNYQSTLIPLCKQNVNVVVINNHIMTDMKKDDLTSNNNQINNSNSNHNNNNNFNTSYFADNQETKKQLHKYDLKEENFEKNKFLVNNYTSAQNKGMDNMNQNNQKNAKPTNNIGIIDHIKKISTGGKNSSNVSSNPKNNLLTNYNNFVGNARSKNSNLIFNNSNIPSYYRNKLSAFNASINQSHVNSSNANNPQSSNYNNYNNNQSHSLNKHEKKSSSLNKSNMNSNNINNKKPNINEVMFAEMIRNKVHANNPSLEKKNNLMSNNNNNINNNDYSHSKVVGNSNYSNKVGNEKDLYLIKSLNPTNNRIGDNAKNKDKSNIHNEILDKEIKTLDSDINHNGKNMIDITNSDVSKKALKHDQVNTIKGEKALNKCGDLINLKDAKTAALQNNYDKKINDSILKRQEIINLKNNPSGNNKQNLRTSFFSQLKHNEDIPRKNAKNGPAVSYLNGYNDKDEYSSNALKISNKISKLGDTSNININTNMKNFNYNNSKKQNNPITNKAEHQHTIDNNISVEKSNSPLKNSSTVKNKANTSKDKDHLNNNNFNNNNNKGQINNPINSIVKNSSINEHEKLKSGYSSKNNINSLLKFGFNSNFSNASKINLKKNLLMTSKNSNIQFNNQKNLNSLMTSYNNCNFNNINNKNNNTDAVNNSIFTFTNNTSKNSSLINNKDLYTGKNMLNQSRNLNNCTNYKTGINSNINNLTTQSDLEQEDQHISKTKDFTYSRMIKNKPKLNTQYNKIQSGVIDLNMNNKHVTHENYTDSIIDNNQRNLFNPKIAGKVTPNQLLISNLKGSENAQPFAITNNNNNNNTEHINNNNNINSYHNSSIINGIPNYSINLTSNNNKFNFIKSEYSMESINSKQKSFINGSNYSSSNQKSISENTNNSKNTIINNNKISNAGIMKSVNTFISNESAMTSEQNLIEKSSYLNQSINFSNIMDKSRNDSRSKSKASDKTTSTIVNFNNFMGMKNNDSELILNYNQYNNLRSGDESESNNSAINLKNFKKNSINFLELKKKLQIKDLDNSSSLNNSSLNKSHNNNTIKEGNSYVENIDYKNIDIKEDYDSSNQSAILNLKSSSKLNAKKFSCDISKEEALKKNLLAQNSNIEYLKSKLEYENF